MRAQPCNGCRIPIRQGFTNGKQLFCMQSCEQDYYDNGNKPVARRSAKHTRH